MKESNKAMAKRLRERLRLLEAMHRYCVQEEGAEERLIGEIRALEGAIDVLER